MPRGLSRDGFSVYEQATFTALTEYLSGEALSIPQSPITHTEYWTRLFYFVQDQINLFLFSQVARKDETSKMEYIVILGCGCSLTLCILTLVILLWHFSECRCALTLMHAQVTSILGSVMIAIFVVIANIVQTVRFFCEGIRIPFTYLTQFRLLQDQNRVIAVALHFLLISSLCCQINIPASLYAEVTWKYCIKEFRIFLLGKICFGVFKKNVKLNDA